MLSVTAHLNHVRCHTGGALPAHTHNPVKFFCLIVNTLLSQVVVDDDGTLTRSRRWCRVYLQDVRT